MKHILQLSLIGELVREYECIADVSKYGFSQECVSLCCSSKRPNLTHKNFIWLKRGEIERLPDILAKIPKRTRDNTEKPVKAYTLEGDFICRYKSAAFASRVLSIDASSIRRCCLGLQGRVGNYIFKYAEQ